MEIVSYDPSLAADLTAAYNRGVRSVPHCYPVTEEWIARALGPTVRAGEAHPLLHSDAGFVARDGGAVVGFVHTAVGPREKGGVERGSIRFLWYERGHRAAGQALLQAAESDLRGKGMRLVEAVRNGDKYFFYHVNCAHLSDQLEHVQALLKFNGYRPIDGEVVLDWPHYLPGEPAASGVEAEIMLEWSKGANLPLLAVRARRDGEEIGVCEALALAEVSDAEAAQDWLFVTWLWVKDGLRGKGLGRHLLQRNLQAMHGVGYRNACISTDWENHRALLFYSNHGFHRVDWTFCLGRELP